MDQLSEQFEEDQAVQSVGERIRAAREKAGFSLAQLSSETRISLRHLEMIEADEFDRLPARTYAVGFSRSVANALGLNSAEIAADVRAVLNAQTREAPRRIQTFEPGDPARVPSARLGWYMALIAIVLLVGAFVFLRGFFSPAASLPELRDETAVAASAQAPAQTQAGAQAATPAAPTGGAVAFTALEEGVWVKFYDATGKQLLQKGLAKGETYTVPADAQGPMVWTARPDALSITVGGQPVARLSDVQKVMKNVPVTAAALLARKPAGTAAPAASGASASSVAAPTPASAAPASPTA